MVFVLIACASSLLTGACDHAADAPDITRESALDATAVLSAKDLVWRNDTSGAQSVWNLVGAQSVGSQPILPAIADVQWKLETAGDLDGNGTTDYAWRHYPDGANSIWFLRPDGTLDHSASTTTVPDANWHMVGSADVDRDGHDDLIWRNAVSGECSVWFMNGETVARSAYFTNPGTEWSLRGVGDLDGDGQPDLVWRHGSGRNVVWFMKNHDGTTIDHSADLTAVGDTSWRLDAVSDVDLDGKADLLWRNTQTGQNAVWFMDGSTLSQSIYLDQVVADAGWRIVGTRRRELHGMEIPAKPGSAAYARGVRRWLVEAATDPVTRRPQTATIVGADGARPLLFTQLRMPDLDFYAKDIGARTFGELGKAMDLHPFVGMRGAPVSATFQDHLDLFGSFAAENVAVSSLRDGPPADGAWSSCDAPLLGEIVSAVGLVPAAATCAAAVGEGVSLCVGSFALGFMSLVACPIAAIEIGTGCAPAAVALCGLNASAASLDCCVGHDQRAWPLPTTCPASPTSATCECRERLPGSHTSSRAGVFSPSYRCAQGSYKILPRFLHEKTGSYAFGGFCRAPTGSGAATHSLGRGTGPVIDTGAWDDVPALTPGHVHDGGGQCDSTMIHAAGSIAGRRAGQPVTEALAYDTETFTAWHNAYGEMGADHYQSTFDTCIGWSDVDPVTHQTDPSSPFEACYRGVVAALPKDGAGNPNWAEEPLLPDYCTSDICGEVHWK